jgi:hypothetical protein
LEICPKWEKTETKEEVMSKIKMKRGGAAIVSFNVKMGLR